MSNATNSTARNNRVLKEGWVYKQTENGKRWQRRWLSCCGARLIYYSSPQGQAEKARDIMNLKRASEIVADASSEREHVFNVAMTKRTYAFQATSPEDCESWVQLLNDQKDGKTNLEDDEEDPLAGEKIEKPALDFVETEEILVVNAYDDFPEGIQKILAKSKLEHDVVEENIQVILNIVRFLYKKRNFKTDTVAAWLKNGNTDNDVVVADTPTETIPVVEVTAGEEGDTSAPAVDVDKGKGEDGDVAAPPLPEIPDEIMDVGDNTANGEQAPVTAETPTPVVVASAVPTSVSGVTRRDSISPLAVKQSIFDKAESMVEEITPKTRKKMFKVGKKLGEGGFGVVFLGTRLADKVEVAIKMMPHVTERHIKTNLRELYFLSILKNPNIVQIYSAFICMDDMWVTEEYMEGGTLTQAVKASPFVESEVAYVARELFKGCAYMHEQKVAHRDIKSANVMLTVKAEVKLIDFGLCGDMSSGKQLRGMVGSPYWMPPEMIRGLRHGYSADTWSAGVCLIELANKKPPKKGNAFKAMFTTGSGAIPKLYKKSKWSDLCQQFFKDMFIIDAAERPLPAQLSSHEFLSKDVADISEMKAKLTEIFQSGAMRAAGFG